MLDELVAITRSPRFEEVNDDLRPAARALCVRSYIRALTLELEAPRVRRGPW